MITLKQGDQTTIIAVLKADTNTFSELGDTAGLDPATDYMHSDLQGVDFTGSDLTRYNFTGADLRNCIALPSPEDAAAIGLILTDATLN